MLPKIFSLRENKDLIGLLDRGSERKRGGLRSVLAMRVMWSGPEKVESRF